MLLDHVLLLLSLLRPAFSQDRVFVRVCRQALGVLCTLGSRTIARVLAATGRSQWDWTNEYRLFSKSPWQTRDLFRPIIKEALAFCPGGEAITLAGDFTHLLKSGKHIPHVSCMRDPLSPPFHTNLVYGLRFFQVTVLCPFRDRKPNPLPARSIPIRFDAAPVTKKPGKRASDEEKATYAQAVKERRTSHAARAAIEEVRKDFDEAGAAGRDLLVALDGGFCNKVFFGKPFDRVKLICRTRKDAVLCLKSEEKGRRFYSKETFTPESVRQDETISWSEGEFFHGGAFHKIRYKEVKNVLWSKGAGRRFLRLIVIAPTGYRLHSKGKMLYRQPAFLLTDDHETPVEKLIAAYLERWQIEVNHREEKSTLGIGNAQVRNHLSVPRQPAFAVAIYSILLLASLKAYGPERTEDYPPPPKWGRPSRRPSCLDIIALLRQQIEANPAKLAKFEMEISALGLMLQAAA